MKKIFAIWIVCVAVMSGAPAFSADFDKGMEAFGKGDYQTALSEWQPLAEQGHANAQFFLGTMYEFGEGVFQDYNQAVKWYSHASEQGNAGGQFFLGLMYNQSKGVPKNNTLAYMWVNLAILNGNVQAVDDINLIAEQMLPEQIVQAKDLVKKCIKQNYQGCSKFSPSITTFTDDLSKGFIAFDNGDYATALQELKPLAEQGDASAQNNLGVMYDKGYGVSQNHQEAVKWYRLSAQQGIAKGQFNLGAMYDKGQGVSQNYQEAIKWYTLSAEQGYELAQFNLGSMYYQGVLGSQDYQQAAKWFKLAAEQGRTAAQNFLGFLYADGQGVPKDYALAYMWHNLAGANGSKEGIELRESIAKAMTPEQIVEAQKLARECVAKDYKGC